MKKIIFCIISIFALVISSYGQNIECVSCKGNTVSFDKVASAIGEKNISTGKSSFAGGSLTQATGDYSIGFGYISISNGLHSIALGSESKATQTYGVAIGRHAYSTNANAIAIGKYAEANGVSSFSLGTNLFNSAGFSVLIGSGAGFSTKLENTTDNSLIIGFNSTVPTLFVGPSSGSNYSGKVGIGNITAPTAKLHIKADNNEDASLKLESTGTSYFAKILLGDDVHTISAKPNADMKFSTPALKNFVFENGIVVTTGLQVTTGNVGIGTSNPQKKLDVTGDIKFTGQIFYNTNALGNWYATTNNIYFNTGNVSIGTSSQQAKLHVETTSGTGLIVKTLHSTPWGYGVISSVLNDDTKSFVVSKGGEDKFVTYGNGKTIIGNSNSSLGGYMLTVHGNIIAEELKIVENVPSSDFVFYPDYNLMSLTNLESFIKENNHLPEIPSADEFKANGYEVGKMDDLLLKKIEELTLYIIQQQKEIDELKSILSGNSNN